MEFPNAKPTAGERHIDAMPILELFPFRYWDAVRGRWIKARYVAERHEIEARHALPASGRSSDRRRSDSNGGHTARIASPPQRPKSLDERPLEMKPDLHVLAASGAAISAALRDVVREDTAIRARQGRRATMAQHRNGDRALTADSYTDLILAEIHRPVNGSQRHQMERDRCAAT